MILEVGELAGTRSGSDGRRVDIERVAVALAKEII